MSALSTQGGFNWDGIPSPIFSLEPTKYFHNLENVPGLTCVPPGVYPLRSHWWTHGGRFVLELVNVPGRSAILIHPYNDPSETKGCIAGGFGPYADDKLYDSRRAVDVITSVGLAAIESGEGADIEITEAFA
jgi:hypothetical protein